MVECGICEWTWRAGVSAAYHHRLDPSSPGSARWCRPASLPPPHAMPSLWAVAGMFLSPSQSTDAFGEVAQIRGIHLCIGRIPTVGIPRRSYGFFQVVAHVVVFRNVLAVDC